MEQLEPQAAAAILDDGSPALDTLDESIATAVVQALRMSLHLTLAALLLAPPAGNAAAPSPEDAPIPAIELEPGPSRVRPAPTPPPEPPVAERPPEPVPPPSPARTPDRLRCDGSPNCRSMTIGGLVAGTLGLGGVIAGVVLFTRPDEVLADDPAYVKSYRPPALVASTLGAGTLISAVLVITAAHRGYKDQRRGGEPRKKSKRSVRVTATGLQGRF